MNKNDDQTIKSPTPIKLESEPFVKKPILKPKPKPKPQGALVQSQLRPEESQQIPIKKSVKLNHTNLRPSQTVNNRNQNNLPPEKLDQEKSQPETKEKKSNALKIIATIIITLLVSVVLIYVIVNFSALVARATFERGDNDISEFIGDHKIKSIRYVSDKLNDLIFLPIVMSYPKPEVVEFPEEETEEKEEPQEEPTPEPVQDNSGGVVQFSTESTLNNQLVIPSLGLRVPVVWDSPVDEETMLANLQHGVVHYLGTAKPGEGLENNTGNIFISGHSSYYSWDPGGYKSIFAVLPNIQVGDQVAIGYYDKVYVYQVYDVAEVAPENVDVVRQDTDKHIVTLMTCVPVGTNERRFIAQAEFIGYAE